MDFKKFSDNLVLRPSVHVAAWYGAITSPIIFYFWGNALELNHHDGLIYGFYMLLTMAFSIILLIIFTIENIKKWRIKNDLSPKLYKLVKYTTLFFFSHYVIAISAMIGFIIIGIIVETYHDYFSA